MVMPRSRSRSLESITRSWMCWCAAKVPDCCSSLSTSVVLPWSTWAMMAMLRLAVVMRRWPVKKAPHCTRLAARAAAVEKVARRPVARRFHAEQSQHRVIQIVVARRRAGAPAQAGEIDAEVLRRARRQPPEHRHFELLARRDQVGQAVQVQAVLRE